MTEAQKFDDWLKANYLFDTSNFIKDEADREKAKSSNPTWMAWHHQQQRIDELESKLKIAVDALKTCKTEEYIHWHEEEGYSPFAETKYRKTFEAEKVAAALKQIEAVS